MNCLRKMIRSITVILVLFIGFLVSAYGTDREDMNYRVPSTIVNTTIVSSDSDIQPLSLAWTNPGMSNVPTVAPWNQTYNITVSWTYTWDSTWDRPTGDCVVTLFENDTISGDEIYATANKTYSSSNSSGSYSGSCTFYNVNLSNSDTVDDNTDLSNGLQVTFRIEQLTYGGDYETSPDWYLTSLVEPKTVPSITVPSYLNADGSVTISWSNIRGSNGGAIKYGLQYSPGDELHWQSLATPGGESYTHNAGDESDRYYYRVYGINDACSPTQYSPSYREGGPVKGKPYPPSSISYPANGSEDFTVTWSSSYGAETYYLQIYRSDTGWVDHDSGTATSYSVRVDDTGGQSAGRYKYRVKATNRTGDRGTWREGTNYVVVPPIIPASITYPSTDSDGNYTVSWSSNSQNTFYQYVLEEQRNGGTWNQIYSGTNTAVGITERTYGTYCYRVKNITTEGYYRGYRTGGSLIVELPGQIQLSKSSYSTDEDGGNKTITVTRTNGNSAVSVNYTTSNGSATAGSDYTATSGTLNWASGDTGNKTFTIYVINDNDDEPDEETVNITLSSPGGGATLGSPSTAVLTIRDDDEAPAGQIQFSTASYNVDEDNSSVIITARRINGNNGSVSVNYATSNGSATAGSDYDSSTGTLNWTDGDTENKTFQVGIINDTNDEPDETFNVTLSNPGGGATIGSPSSATITIVDDDSTPSAGQLQFSASSYSVDEDAGSATITVTRTGGSDGSVSVDYTTSNGTAIAGADYTAASGTLNWIDGDTENKTFNVPITNDDTHEENETINLALSEPTNGATLGNPSTVVLTIRDEDPIAENYVTLDMKEKTSPANADIIIPMHLICIGNVQPASFQVDVTFDSAKLTFVEATAGQAATDAGKTVTPSTVEPGIIRLLVAGLNQNIIGDGTVVNFSVHVGDIADGDYPLILSNALCSDPTGSPVVTDTNDGNVNVGGDPYDPNDDGATNIFDVQICINQALGQVTGHPDADCNDDGTVNIFDVQLIINCALGL